VARPAGDVGGWLDLVARPCRLTHVVYGLVSHSKVIVIPTYIPVLADRCELPVIDANGHAKAGSCFRRVTLFDGKLSATCKPVKRS